MSPTSKERKNRWGKREVTLKRLHSPSYKTNQTKQTKEKRKQATVEKTSSINKDGLAIGCSEWSLFISTSLTRRGSREVWHILMVLSTFELLHSITEHPAWSDYIGSLSQTPKSPPTLHEFRGATIGWLSIQWEVNVNLPKDTSRTICDNHQPLKKHINQSLQLLP